MKVVVTRESKKIQEFDFPFSNEKSISHELNYFVGRSSECHIVIQDHKISRNHAHLFFKDQIWHIKSNSDKSPLFVNGTPISEVPITDEDVVRIGDYNLQFDFSDTGTAYTKSRFQEILTGGTSAMTEVISPQSDQTISSDETNFMSKTEVLSGQQKDEELQQSTENNEEPETDNVEEEDLDNNSFEAPDGEEGVEVEEFENEANEFSEESEADSFGDDFSNDFQDGDGEFNEDMETSDDEGFGGELDTADKTAFIKSFIEFELEISGPYSNFDKFYLNKDEVFIGRDPSQCQIVLEDPECSQVHAVLRKRGMNYMVEDLKSSNGTMLNGKRILNSPIKDKDEFLIGTTSFKVIVKSDLLSSQKEVLMPVDSTQEIEIEEIIEEEVDILDDDDLLDDELALEGGQAVASSGNASLFSKETWSDPEKRKKPLFIIVGLLLLWVLLDDGGSKKKAPKKQDPKQANRSLFPDENTEGGNSVAGSAQQRTIDQLDDETKKFVIQNYELAKTEIISGNFGEGLRFLDRVYQHVDLYKESRDLEQFAKDELAKIEKLEKERKAEEERRAREIKIKEYLVNAQKAFDEEKIELTKSLMNKILELDPENLEVSQLKLQLDAYIKDKERKALEEAVAKARRDRLINELKPGKTLYLKEKWYQAIIELEEFLNIKDNDEDLITEATNMLKGSQKNLSGLIDPLLGKARSLKEGQDFKGAYETYQEILDISPTNEEALDQIVRIKQTLDFQAKRVYREALIDESLSLLKKAKEKFQEVQQISPRDSEYYKKASAKLKNYLD